MAGWRADFMTCRDPVLGVPLAIASPARRYRRAGLGRR